MTPRFHPGSVRNVPDLVAVIQDIGMWPVRFDHAQEAVAELVSAAIALIALVAGIAIKSLPSPAAEFNAGRPARRRLKNLDVGLCLRLRKLSVRLCLTPIFARGLADGAPTLANRALLGGSVSGPAPMRDLATLLPVQNIRQ
jgi:hypothetical protein